jgi:hypothetical protein
VCRQKNVGTNIKFLIKLGKSGSEIGDMLDLAPNDFFSIPEDKGNVERKAYL